MTEAQLELNEWRAAALAWWRQRRPVGWTEADHAEAPWVNISGKPENDLARLCSRYLDSLAVGSLPRKAKKR